MPRFFITDFCNDKVVIFGEDSIHIKKSLRMKIGDSITLSDGKGYEYYGIIENIDNDIIVSVLSKQKSLSEPKFNIHLYQCLPKGDKFDLIVQKCVELGVTEITPVISNRVISRPDDKSFYKKLIRYNKISTEAAKQSGRSIIPNVNNILSFNQAVNNCTNIKGNFNIIFYEKYGDRINDILGKNNEISDISIFLGSEGGFDSSEIYYVQCKGFNICSLGNRILRCETAPITAISIIMNILGDI